jgi:hypothetical protein
MCRPRKCLIAHGAKDRDKFDLIKAKRVFLDSLANDGVHAITLIFAN